MSVPALRIVEETGSTNDDVLELGRIGAPHGTAVFARRQTAGRGRRGHAWSSEAGRGVFLSVLLRPAVAPALWAGLPAACGVAVAEALGAFGVSDVRLKWPNDVVLRDRKLAGILVESSGDFAVAGVGVNLVAPEVLPACDGAGIPALAPIGLADALGAVPNADTVARRLQQKIVERADAWAGELLSSGEVAPLAPVLAAYQERLYLKGAQVSALAPDGTTLGAGVLCGVDAWGRAVLLAPDGTEQRFAAGQASLRPVG